MAKINSDSYHLVTDDLLAAFIYVVVRASVLQLGSEINFIKDFIQDSRLEHGEFDFAFTTLTVSNLKTIFVLSTIEISRNRE